MPVIKDIDYGTPLRVAETLVTLEIDGKAVTVPAGTSVMRAAVDAGVQVPKLCATDNVEAFGSCRLCLVEVEGRRGTPASCTTLAEPGMKVRTQSPKLAKLRRGVMELYISDHPLDCLTCAANGDCELQDMAGVVGLREVRYGNEGQNPLKAPKDESNPYFTFEAAKCIVCSRCVRACEEVQGTFALTIQGRGFASQVASGPTSFLDSECVSCGACVQACPTATLSEKTIIAKGQPEHSVVTTCAYCGVGCAFKAEVKGGEVVRMTPYKDGKANHGHSCVKGRFAWGYTTHKDRVYKPMIRTAFGNNNTDTCARVCHSPTGYGLSNTYGTSAGTQDFDSVEEADVIMVIGANPTDAHPVFASQMKRRLRQGARLIILDPRRIDLVKSPHVQADYHLPLLPGTNVAIINALAHV